jgi:hypothetical protein
VGNIFVSSQDYHTALELLTSRKWAIKPVEEADDDHTVWASHDLARGARLYKEAGNKLAIEAGDFISIAKSEVDTGSDTFLDLASLGTNDEVAWWKCFYCTEQDYNEVIAAAADDEALRQLLLTLPKPFTEDHGLGQLEADLKRFMAIDDDGILLKEEKFVAELKNLEQQEADGKQESQAP